MFHVIAYLLTRRLNVVEYSWSQDPTAHGPCVATVSARLIDMHDNSTQDSRALRRASSLILNTPGKSSTPVNLKGATANTRWQNEVVPDSEEERRQRYRIF